MLENESEKAYENRLWHLECHVTPAIGDEMKVSARTVRIHLPMKWLTSITVRLFVSVISLPRLSFSAFCCSPLKGSRHAFHANFAATVCLTNPRTKIIRNTLFRGTDTKIFFDRDLLS